MVRPFDDAGIVAGQGTIGLEIARQAACARREARCGSCSLQRRRHGERDCACAFRRQPRHGGDQRRAGKVRRHAPVACGGRTQTRRPAARLSMADALMAPIPGDVPFALAKKLMKAGPWRSPTTSSPRRGLCGANAEINHRTGRKCWARGACSAADTTYTERPSAVVLTGGNCDFETVAACVAQRIPTLKLSPRLVTMFGTVAFHAPCFRYVCKKQDHWVGVSWLRGYGSRRYAIVAAVLSDCVVAGRLRRSGRCLPHRTRSAERPDIPDLRRSPTAYVEHRSGPDAQSRTFQARLRRRRPAECRNALLSGRDRTLHAARLHQVRTLDPAVQACIDARDRCTA